jgi:hypothetical protein
MRARFPAMGNRFLTQGMDRRLPGHASRHRRCDRQGGAIMNDWSVEDLARLSATRLRFARLRQAQRGPKSTAETRIALVAFEHGLSDSELEQFYFVNRKGRQEAPFRRARIRKKVSPFPPTREASPRDRSSRLRAPIRVRPSRVAPFVDVPPGPREGFSRVRGRGSPVAGSRA